MENKKFYMTTAIAYTSGKPHIGNTYEFVLADAIARYKRSQGYDVWFQTGTDEHGQKIELKAKDAGMEPQAFVDGVAAQVKEIADIIKANGGVYLEEVKLFDVYQGAQIEADYKSVAYSIAFSSAEKTLSDADIADAMDAMLKELAEKLGAQLRDK